MQSFEIICKNLKETQVLAENFSKLVENDKFDVRKLSPKDIEEMRKAIRRPKGLSVQ